jgi:hypothetical protein
MDEMRSARLVECSDHDYDYGILHFKNASLDEVQEKIYEIKSKFDDEEWDWTIDDVLEEFPEEWECWLEEIEQDDYLEI